MRNVSKSFFDTCLFVQRKTFLLRNVDSNTAGTSVSSEYTSVYRQHVSDGLPLNNGAPETLNSYDSTRIGNNI